MSEKEPWKQKAVELNETTGLSWRKIAKELGVAKSTVSDYLRSLNKERNTREFDVIGKVNMVGAMLRYNGKTATLHIKTRTDGKGGKTHFIIPDAQCKPNVDLNYLRCIGEYIADKQPDVIVNLGDFADMESLSSYDKGKKSAEGKRVYKDIEASIKGMNALLTPIKNKQDETGWTPRMVMLLGNHEHRILRHVEENPELDGFLSYDNLKYKENGWEVYDFLEPVVIDGICYSHYFPNPMTGKPLGGSALNMLKTIGTSFIMGHRQCLDVATRTLHSGQHQWGIVIGAGYEHDEGYKSYMGNKHWRGVAMLHNVDNGSFDPMFVKLDYLKERYGK